MNLNNDNNDNDTITSTAQPCTEQAIYVFVHYLFLYAMTPIILLGLLLNTLNFIVFHREKSKLCAVFLLKVLAINDIIFLLMCAILFPIRHLISALENRHIVLSNPDNSIGPWLYYAIFPWYFSFLQSRNWIIVLVSVDRFLNLVFPLWARSRITIDFTIKIVWFIFLVSILCHIPRYWAQFVGLATERSCDTQYQIEYLFWEQVYDQTVYICLMVFVPMLILYGLNIGLCVALRRSAKMREKLTSKSKSDFRLQSQATWMVISIIIVFTITETPAALDRIALMFSTGVAPNDVIVNSVRKSALLLIVIDSSANFIGYYISNRRFRRGLKQVFCFHMKVDEYSQNSNKVCRQNEGRLITYQKRSGPRMKPDPPHTYIYHPKLWTTDLTDACSSNNSESFDGGGISNPVLNGHV